MKVDYSKFESDGFKKAIPFPHTVIDNLFDNDFLNKLNDRYPKDGEVAWWKYDNIFERKLAFDDIRKLDKIFEEYFNVVNSFKFVKTLESLTGINNLIADPSLRGGGLHRIKRGGKLDIHADFNYHKITGWHRRLNVITFLNKDWLESFGGHTEFWSIDMSRCITKVLPIFNRTVIFIASEYSWHGHPHPLTCPEDRERRSLATYYYSLPDGHVNESSFASTNYQKLPDKIESKEVERLRKLRRMGRLKDSKQE